MTSEEMKDELVLLLGNRSSNVIADTRYYLWLSSAQKEICGVVEVPELVTTGDVDQEDDTATYDIPSEITLIYGIKCNHNNRLLRPSGYRKLYNVDLTSSGDPTHWMREGSQFRAYPVPAFSSGTRTFTVRGVGVLTDMSASVEPTLSWLWEECILLGGEYRGWKALREYDRYLAAKNEFLSLVRSRRTEDMIEDEHSDFGIQMRRR